MTQYIDKDTLAAEIEKRYKYWREKEFNSHSIESETRMSECQYLMLLLNTLEVKEVNKETPDGTGYIVGVVDDDFIEDFKKHMKGE